MSTVSEEVHYKTNLVYDRLARVPLRNCWCGCCHMGLKMTGSPISPGW